MAITKPRLQVYEILDQVSKKRAKKDKIQVLQENEMMALRDVLRGTFDEIIQWNLPSGPVPYTPASEETPANPY